MKKKGLFSILAAGAAVAVAAVAATTYIKKKSESIADYLDYEPEDDEEIIIKSEEVEVVEELETVPPFPAEQEAVLENTEE